MRREITMSTSKFPGWAVGLAIAAAVMLPLTSCAGPGGKNETQSKDEAMKSGVHDMLEEIYSSRKPVRFEQLDVSEIVVKHIPLGTEKAAISSSFKSSPTSKIVEDSADKLVVRDNKGQAMLDPDARSVVITFNFDASGKLTKVGAVHLKNQ
jgi:hypothetical protein